MTDASSLVHKIEKGEKELKVGRSNDLLQVHPETEKKNPNSLRFLFGHIINFYFEGDRTKAAENMEITSIYAAKRTPTKKIRASALGKILKDKDHIEYWHIEAFAKATQIPSTGLLALSLAYSMIRKGQYDAVKKLGAGFRALADHLDRMADTQEISKKMMVELSDDFKQSQIELFEINHNIDG
jgi:hypothetical protein